MKKLTFLLLCSVIPVTIFAQKTAPKLRFGLKAGGSLSKMTIDNEIKSGSDAASFKSGCFAGAMLEISNHPKAKFKGQMEVLYNYYNFKNVYNLYGAYPVETKIHLSQLSVPVMVKYMVIPSLSVNLGVSVNFNLGGKAEEELVGFDQPSYVMSKLKNMEGFNRVQSGALVGISYSIYKNFFMDARYNYYFGKMLDGNDMYYFDYKNMSAFQLSVGYRF